MEKKLHLSQLPKVNKSRATVSIFDGVSPNRCYFFLINNPLYTSKARGKYTLKKYMMARNTLLL